MIVLYSRPVHVPHGTIVQVIHVQKIAIATIISNRSLMNTPLYMSHIRRAVVVYETDLKGYRAVFIPLSAA